MHSGIDPQSVDKIMSVSNLKRNEVLIWLFKMHNKLNVSYTTLNQFKYQYMTIIQR